MPMRPGCSSGCGRAEGRHERLLPVFRGPCGAQGRACGERGAARLAPRRARVALSVYLIAGEPSGDRLGGALMAGLKDLAGENITFHGVGGAAMQAEGLESLFPMQELSVMGIAEVLPKYFHLKRRIAEVAAEVLRLKPDVLITIDSPDFCLRVAKQVRADSPDQRTVHYVAPTVWAWRSGRAAKMAPMIDQVLALFPFEPPFMEAEGMRCDFVGHPVVSEPQATADEAAAFRDRVGMAPGAPMILALPGSRKGEIARFAERFGAALAPAVAAHPGAQVVVPTVPHLTGFVCDQVADWPGAPLVLDPRNMPAEAAAAEKRAAFAAADVALAASGTVSLELAAADTPMVIGYDVAWASWQIIKRMLKTDTVTLVNLVSETRAVPEFIGDKCQPGPMGEALLEVIANPEAQRAAMAVTMQRLGQGGEAPGLRAARAVLEGMGRSA